MSVLAWAAIAVYVVGWLAALRPMGRVVSQPVSSYDWADVAFLAVLVPMTAVGWPFLALALSARWCARAAFGTPDRAARALLGESRRDRTRRLERERQDREAYIADLERQVGIDADG